MEGNRDAVDAVLRLFQPPSQTDESGKRIFRRNPVTGSFDQVAFHPRAGVFRPDGNVRRDLHTGGNWKRVGRTFEGLSLFHLAVSQRNVGVAMMLVKDWFPCGNDLAAPTTLPSFFRNRFVDFYGPQSRKQIDQVWERIRDAESEPRRATDNDIFNPQARHSLFLKK